MKTVLVIHEKDLDDEDKIVVGVADSIENAEKVIKEYYGEFKEISYNDIRDSNLEFFPLTSSQLLEIDELIEDLNLPNLIITIHPACQFKPSEIYRNILFNGRDCNKDLYSDLLPNSLCVISDLSSVLIEARFFGIKDYCYFPDKEDYIKSSRPVIHNMYEKYCGNSWNSFINILLDSKKHDLYKNNFSYKFNNPCHKVASIIKNHE